LRYDTTTTQSYNLSLHDALPIFLHAGQVPRPQAGEQVVQGQHGVGLAAAEVGLELDHGVAALARQAAHGVDQQPLQALGEVGARSEEHTSELQSRENLVCRLLLE